MQDTPFQFSRHAARRAQQRGITLKRLHDALDIFDTDLPCGYSAYALTLSSAAAVRLKKEGYPVQELDRLQRLRVVVAEDATVVTVMHRYRRPKRRHSKLDSSAEKR